MSRRDLTDKYGKTLDARRAIREAIRAELPGGAKTLEAIAELQPHARESPYREILALLRRAVDHMAGEIRRRYEMVPQTDDKHPWPVDREGKPLPPAVEDELIVPPPPPPDRR